MSDDIPQQAINIDVNGTIELSPLEKERLTTLLQHCVTPAAITIDALMICQRERGWISDETLAAIAKFIGISISDLDSVATFYNLIFRQQVARIVLHPCNGMACQLLGSDKIEEKISQYLGICAGETDNDKQFTLVPLPCLGACDKAPIMIADRKLFQLMEIDKIPQILQQLISGVTTDG